MHNYHDVHRKFPSPVVIGEDGKTPHSWRVAILPFVDELELYNQYRFDEPWDSEHNKKLAEQIPKVYRHPKDKSDSTNASYFALVGSKTLMGDGKRATWIGDITDGTSNTLMIVEAKRDIPWTKPEDIAYPEDRAKAVPELGGWFKDGFLTVMGDGAALFISSNTAKDVLQNMIERNDGNPINHEDFSGQVPRFRGPRPAAVKPQTPEARVPEPQSEGGDFGTTDESASAESTAGGGSSSSAIPARPVRTE
jgi:hypothetical protein